MLGGSGQLLEAGAAAELNWDLGAATLTYLGAHRNSRRESTDDINLGPFVEHRGGKTEATQNSHELRLSSAATQPLKWIAGLYTFNETQSTDAFFAGGALTFKLPYIYGKSDAVFGQATYSIAPELPLLLVIWKPSSWYGLPLP